MGLSWRLNHLLLPALMLLIGERVWWLPKPLQRWLPKVELHPA